jgi:hypothetical protein
MLIRINEKFVIKTDRYCFMICVDKGMRPFPGGIVRQYFEPSKYCHSLKQTIECKTTHDGGHYDVVNVFDGCKLPDDYIEACNKENELYEFLESSKFSEKEYELFECKVKPCRNYYTVSIPGRDVYPSTLASSIFTCHSSNLRENLDFGVASGDNIVESDWSKVIKAISQTKEFAEKIIDSN